MKERIIGLYEASHVISDLLTQKTRNAAAAGEYDCPEEIKGLFMAYKAVMSVLIETIESISPDQAAEPVAKMRQALSEMEVSSCEI